jgi:hypothetical protein
MAITQAMCTSFKVALLDGEMDFSSDTSQVFKIALYTSAATLGAATTAYSVTNEVSGTGYTAGGQAIIVSTAPTDGGSGTTAFLSFKQSGAAADTVTWTDATITARGALIYKVGGTNPAIAVLDFGADKTSTAGDFQVQFPTADATNAIVRIATP